MVPLSPFKSKGTDQSSETGQSPLFDSFPFFNGKSPLPNHFSINHYKSLWEKGGQEGRKGGFDKGGAKGDNRKVKGEDNGGEKTRNQVFWQKPSS